MDQKIFREKSIERITSPEQLQDYMRVTTPGIWMVLVAVIALLAGLVISSALCTLESTLNVKGTIDDGGMTITMTLPAGQGDRVYEGQLVRVAGTEAHVDYIYRKDGQTRVTAAFSDDHSDLPAGEYSAQIVVETIKPINFLLN